MEPKIPLYWKLLIGVLLIVVPALMIYLDAANEQFRADTQTSTAQATITSAEPRNHNSASWRLIVNGEAYTGGDAIADRVKPGDSVKIRYNPLDPSQNSLGARPPMTIVGYVSGWSVIDFAILFNVFLICRSREKGRVKKSVSSTKKFAKGDILDGKAIAP